MLRSCSALFTCCTRRYCHRAPEGCLFTPFLKKKHLVVNHPLDTELDKYYWTLENVVTPACMELSPVTEYSERIKEAVLYNTPAFNDCWNFGVELTYRKLIPEEEQTEENLTQARILRIGMDLAFAMSAVLDDIADVSTMRRSKPAWHTFCPGGVNAAMYDGMVIGYLPFILVDRFFKGHPGYGIMMDAYAKANTRMIIGEIMDVSGHKAQNLTKDHHRNIIGFKAGHFVAPQPTLGMALAGITDEKLISQMEKIFYTFGTLIQTWDDFNDYFSSQDQTGKPACDFYNAGNTWVSATALEIFTPQQKKLFLENYGSSDPKKMAVVSGLYTEIDIPGLYISFMRNVYKQTEIEIGRLSDPRLKDVCYSFMDWLIGGVADGKFESLGLNNNDKSVAHSS